MVQRINITMDEKLSAVVKEFARRRKLPFSTVLSIAAENLLKSEGYALDDELNEGLPDDEIIAKWCEATAKGINPAELIDNAMAEEVAS